MKRTLTLILCIAMLLSFAGCTIPPAETESQTEATESPFAGIVADPKSWYAEFESLPIANENMTTDELRQLCVDAFRMNMSFTWTPNVPITYQYTLLKKPYDVELPTGIAYSGLCYATGHSGGHIYKVLSYYDKETGVLDVASMGSNMRSILTSACAYGAQQAWNRVSNSHNLTYMSTYNRFDSNTLPVGPYTYEVITYNHNFGSRTATAEIIEFNGAETMYESFAQMHKADGLYSSPSWHVMMCSSEPVVVRKANGAVDPEQSYVLVYEQRADGTRSDKYNTQQENGITLRPLGTLDKKYTFKRLLDKGYIPFTLKEFLGEDPVEPGEVWICKGQTRLEQDPDLEISAISDEVVYANYCICVVEGEVRTPDGQVLLSYDPSLQTKPTDSSVPLRATIVEDKIAPYMGGENTLHIYVRLANGERIEAFSTILK